jgi:hypothetical protein
MEACGQDPWFERLRAEMGYEWWLGDAAAIRAPEVRQQKRDRRDAEHLLELLRQGAVSADLGGKSGGAGRAAAAEASPQTGAGADASYFGPIPSEHSSGGRQQLGRISKQSSSFLRFLLVERADGGA